MFLVRLMQVFVAIYMWLNLCFFSQVCLPLFYLWQIPFLLSAFKGHRGYLPRSVDEDVHRKHTAKFVEVCGMLRVIFSIRFYVLRVII